MHVTKPRPLAVRILKELAWIAVFVAVYWIISADQAPALAVGQRAPAFTADRIGGGPNVSISPALHKQKVLVFWAPWCRVCATELPLLGDLQKNLGDKVQVVGVGLSGSREEMQKFVGKKAADFPHVYAPEEADAFGIKAFPTIFVLDADNVVKARYVGFTTAMRIKIGLR